ncbi:hypothetical protein E4T43_03460 [Aureobasidium subglaciale]|nr:hypothetical protein E4T43_03460 [Aureobasidium subglaciale]
MAASVWHNAVNTATTTTSYASLPNGSCNFRPLSSGSQAATCGCRRFWLDKPLDSHNGSSVLCACGHHACFHDVTVDANPPPTLMRHSSAPSVPADNHVGHSSSLLVGPQIQPPIIPPQIKSRYDRIKPPEVAPLSNDVWGRLNNFARWQQDPTWIPSTAPASVLSYEPQNERRRAPSEPSPVKSTTSNERRYASLFPNMDGLMGSPTVQGTPTAEYVPDSIRIDVPPNAHYSQGDPESTQSQPSMPSDAKTEVCQVEDAKPCLEVTKFIDHRSQEAPSTPTKTVSIDVQNILQSCVRRLETLETYSFSQVPLDEVQEKFELFDGRLLEMEYWKKDIDARLEKSQLALEDQDSQASTSFQMLQARGSKALFSRVSDVEHRLADLESAQPSYANPWEIEVVLLPFGRTLKGVWHDSTDSDPNPLPSTPGAQCDERRSSGGLLAMTGNKGPAWTPDTIEAWASTINPWLWPKAPGPNSNLFKRLQSRGLVRKVSIVDTGAHGIWESVKDAFADFVETQPYHRTNNQQQPYEALREAFVPLRKIKKSSWLRYLEPHELITPATWDISFLDSGVFMNGKGGRKRLYMTTADGYIQPGKTGWTWPQIRELPRYENAIARSGSLFHREAPSEPFWGHMPALDDAPSFSSFISQVSNTSLGKRRSSGVTFEDQEPASPSAKSYTSSSSGHTITPRYSESFPIITKRVSEPRRRTSPSCTPVAYQKRRRTSGSPSRYRGGLEELTPRWSHEPPTPMMENVWETRSHCRAGSSRKRLSTPTAYATPHSHNVANVVDLAMADGGDTEVESVGSGAAESEHEWAGLDEDGDDSQMSQPNSQSSFSASEWLADDDEREDVDDDGDSLYEP